MSLTGFNSQFDTANSVTKAILEQRFIAFDCDMAFVRKCFSSCLVFGSDLRLVVGIVVLRAKCLSNAFFPSVV